MILCCFHNCKSQAEWSSRQLTLCDIHTQRAEVLLERFDRGDTGHKEFESLAERWRLDARLEWEADQRLDELEKIRRFNKPAKILKHLPAELLEVLHTGLVDALDTQPKLALRELAHRRLITLPGDLTQLGRAVLEHHHHIRKA